jgi:hypothetical protein
MDPPLGPLKQAQVRTADPFGHSGLPGGGQKVSLTGHWRLPQKCPVRLPVSVSVLQSGGGGGGARQ